MKKNFIVEAIACLFFLLFTYTALAKILTFKTFEFDLARDPLLKNYSMVMAVSTPLIELVVSTFLLIPKFRKIGLYGSFILMSLFSLYVIYILAFNNEEKHCTCGGFIRQMSWTQHLWFNIILTLIALFGIILNKWINKLPRESKNKYLLSN
ncbi:MauE/DoxX family redox-associated membrane protein [Niastella sp. OAS944]|uniref:MauE/DoxX family redox-associated membrane protein n=1 Tax=Niastella sp. OAS944 TaxID=2664089 RepID=UPI00346D0AC3|nr:hypothetical protein [Chitinophagaceae bacterium OAS944]